MVGLKGAYALTEKWSIQGSAEYFRIDVEETKDDGQLKYDYDGAFLYLGWHI